MRPLTMGQYRAVEALCEYPSQREAAESLGIALQTFKNQLYEARRRAGSVSNEQLAYALGAGDLDKLLPELDDDE